MVKSCREIGKKKKASENEICGGNGHPQGKGDNRQRGARQVVVCRISSLLPARFRDFHLQVGLNRDRKFDFSFTEPNGNNSASPCARIVKKVGIRLREFSAAARGSQDAGSRNLGSTFLTTSVSGRRGGGLRRGRCRISFFQFFKRRRRHRHRKEERRGQRSLL